MMNTGIYIIINILNGKIYVGSSSSPQGLKNRWNRHLYFFRNNKHNNVHLQRTYNKYGEGIFRFFVIERCESIICIEREQYWIDLLKPDYNMCPKAGSSLGYKHTEESKRIMSALKKGIRPSEEHIKKSALARVGLKQPYEVRKKRFKRILQYSLEGDFIREWDSITNASKTLNVFSQGISRACKNKSQYSGKFQWRYWTENYLLKIDSINNLKN